MKYRFFVDAKQYESTEQIITAEQIRKIANILPRMRVFLGHAGDGTVARQITQGSTVDLALPGEEHFYTLAPPSMDIN